MLIAFNTIIFILGLYFIGDALAFVFKTDLEQKNISKLVSNILFALAAVILCSHLCSFVFHNFTLCSKIVFYMASLSSLAILYQNNRLFLKNNLTNIEWIILLVSSLFAVLMGLRRMFYSQPDNFHLAVVSGIFHNSDYPPVLSSNPEISLSSYHYGTDLITVLIQSVTGVDAFVASALQIAFATFCAFMSLFALIDYISDKQKSSLLYALFIGLYTSSNSIEYLFKKLSGQIPAGNNFLRDWFINSCTSVTHLTAQLRLPSQSLAWSLCFLLILYLIIFFKEQKKLSPAILLLSFLLYFIFPAYYYPLVAGALITCVGMALFSKEKLKQLVTCIPIIVVMLLGKVLTFTSNHGMSNGVNGLIFRFNSAWTIWTQEYLFNFYSRNYLQALPTTFDFTDNKIRLAAPFFSILSLREFLMYFLIALILLVIFLLQKKNITSEIWFLFVTATISMSAPFGISFLPREIETHRFLMFAKIIFIICSMFIAIKFIQQKKLNIIVLVLFSFSCVPGLISLMPIKNYIQNQGTQVSEQSKQLITALAKFHQDKNVCLDNINFVHGHTLCELAGFYGVGGRMYQYDYITRDTALLTLDYSLLKALNVDYILFNEAQFARLDEQSLTKLRDKHLFEMLDLGVEGFHFYRFNKDKVSELAEANSIKWVQACRKGNKFIAINKSSQKLTTVEIDDLASKIQDKDRICAYWLSQQAIVEN